MNLDFSPETETFRQTVRTFFETDFPKDILEKNRAGHALTTAEVRKSEMALGAKGWLASAWPEEYGGPGWSVEEQYVFDEELERAGVPTVTPMGVVYVGPVLYTFGSDAQKEKWLPGIRDGSVGWAQGYSEPGSGSDLASLQFSAVLENGTYTLNGHKIWTSAAQHADWIFLLTRTSNEGKKQEGITFICCPIDAPGVTVKPSPASVSCNRADDFSSWYPTSAQSHIWLASDSVSSDWLRAWVSASLSAASGQAGVAAQAMSRQADRAGRMDRMGRLRVRSFPVEIAAPCPWAQGRLAPSLTGAARLRARP